VRSGSILQQIALLLISPCLVLCVYFIFLGWGWNGIENRVGGIVNLHVCQYIAVLLIFLSLSSVCYCIVMSYCMSCILGWRCKSVNSAALAQISFAAAASLVRPCVMISLWMNLLWIHFVYGALPLHFQQNLCFKRDNMDYHFTYLTVKYRRDKLSIFQTGFSSC
jgi:hypothetical protein